MKLSDVTDLVFGKSSTQEERNAELERMTISEEARAGLLEKEAEIRTRLNAASLRSVKAKQQMGTKQMISFKWLLFLAVIVVAVFLIAKNCGS